MNHFVRANHEEGKLLKGIWRHNRSEGFASRSELRRLNQSRKRRAGYRLDYSLAGSASFFSTAISRGGGQKPDLNGAAH